MAAKKKGEESTKKMRKKKNPKPTPIPLDKVPEMLEKIRKGLELRHDELMAKQKAWRKKNRAKLARAKKAGKKRRPTEMEKEMLDLEALHPTLGFISNGIHVDCDMDDDESNC